MKITDLKATPIFGGRSPANLQRIYSKNNIL